MKNLPIRCFFIEEEGLYKAVAGEFIVTSEDKHEALVQCELAVIKAGYKVLHKRKRQKGKKNGRLASVAFKKAT